MRNGAGNRSQHQLCLQSVSRSAPAYILFIYRNVKRKQTQKVNPMIEMKKEEIYELCEKGHKLLL